jgi:hypothetical protein
MSTPSLALRTNHAGTSDNGLDEKQFAIVSYSHNHHPTARVNAIGIFPTPGLDHPQKLSFPLAYRYWFISHNKGNGATATQ